MDKQLLPLSRHLPALLVCDCFSLEPHSTVVSYRQVFVFWKMTCHPLSLLHVVRLLGWTSHSAHGHEYHFVKPTLNKIYIIIMSCTIFQFTHEISVKSPINHYHQLQPVIFKNSVFVKQPSFPFSYLLTFKIFLLHAKQVLYEKQIKLTYHIFYATFFISEIV